MAVRNLNVELCGASGLKNSEFIGKSDPYVILSIGKTERTSKVAKNQATDPSWNEKFSLPVLETDTELVIRILNHNTLGKDDEMGRVLIPLSEIHASTYGLQHKGKAQGEIKLNLSYGSEGGHESKGLIEKIEGLGVGEKHDEALKEKEEVSEEKKKDAEKTEEKKKEKKKKVKSHWFVHTPKSYGYNNEEECREGGEEGGEEGREEGGEEGGDEGREEGGEEGGESSSSSSSESEQEEQQ